MAVHSCPVSITGSLVSELTQEHLRLTADQAHLSSLTANSSWFTQGTLGKPYCLTLAASH